MGNDRIEHTHRSISVNILKTDLFFVRGHFFCVLWKSKLALKVI